MSDLKPHRIECRIEDSTPVWRIVCPYDADERDKPCAAYSDYLETSDPHEFLSGCGAVEWMAESGDSIEDMMERGITGPVGARVGVVWRNDCWVLTPWPTGAERYLAGRMEDPAYRAAYEAETNRLFRDKQARIEAERVRFAGKDDNDG